MRRAIFVLLATSTLAGCVGEGAPVAATPLPYETIVRNATPKMVKAAALNVLLSRSWAPTGESASTLQVEKYSDQELASNRLIYAFVPVGSDTRVVVSDFLIDPTQSELPIPLRPDEFPVDVSQSLAALPAAVRAASSVPARSRS